MRLAIGALVLALCVVPLLLSPSAQRPPKEDNPAVDPYTKDDPEAKRAAGYVSFGPFPFGDGHDTAQVDHVLGEEARLRWVETAHFKIGCGLAPYSLSGATKAEREKIRGELERLARKIPDVRPSAPRLDRWLRLHLFAQRAEDLYAEFLSRLRRKDEDFPRGPAAGEGAPYRGEGPYLGQPAKYTLLLVQKASVFGHYFQTFAGREGKTAMRHNFARTGSLFFGTAVEFDEAEYRSDTALHCRVVFNLAHNLMGGYKFYSHDLPLWWTEGLAHAWARRIDPRYSTPSEIRIYAQDPEMAWDWEPRVRARVDFDEFPRAAELLRIVEWQKMDFVDHMMAWSRVEFLLGLGDEKFALFLDRVKGPLEPSGRIPTTEEILARQEAALEEAWGFDLEGFDAAWTAHVKKTYRRK
jgi:hypothetical protein